jgi:hypothetical protein
MHLQRRWLFLLQTVAGLDNSKIYKMYHLKSNPTTITYYGTQMKTVTVLSPCSGFPISPVTHELRSPSLLGRCSRQLRKSCADANMVYSRAERVFILENYFSSESYAAIPKALNIAHPDKGLPIKKTGHWMVTTVLDTGNICDRKHVRLRAVLRGVKLCFKCFLTKDK